MFFRQRRRLEGFDYYSYGPFFVTICTEDKQNLFGFIEDGIFYYHSPEIGDIFSSTYNIIEDNFPGVKFKEGVTMPDHVHFIVANASNGKFSLADIVKEFKILVYRSYRDLILQDKLPRYNGKFWHKDFFDNLIIDSNQYYEIATYIKTNPQNYKK